MTVKASTNATRVLDARKAAYGLRTFGPANLVED